MAWHGARDARHEVGFLPDLVVHHGGISHIETGETGRYDAIEFGCFKHF